jgi:serine/threonine protein kinase
LRDDGARLPDRIGRFHIRRRLGSGAFGTVYLADDPVLERQVALKVMRRDAPGGSAAQTRFVREAKAAARLNHPQIVPVFDAGQDGEHLFIAAEYVQGETLEREIERGLPEPTRGAWICQRLAAALHYAHRSGIVHRDVKSGNVMVDSTGDVHLMDFGYRLAAS